MAGGEGGALQGLLCAAAGHPGSGSSAQPEGTLGCAPGMPRAAWLRSTCDCATQRAPRAPPRWILGTAGSGAAGLPYPQPPARRGACWEDCVAHNAPRGRRMSGLRLSRESRMGSGLRLPQVFACKGRGDGGGALPLAARDHSSPPPALASWCPAWPADWVRTPSGLAPCACRPSHWPAAVGPAPSPRGDWPGARRRLGRVLRLRWRERS